MKLLIVLLMVLGPALSSAAVVIEESFESGKAAPGWSIGSQSGGRVWFDTESAHRGKYSLKASYPIPKGALYAWADFNVAKYQTYEVKVEFWARMPDAKQGLKFMKVFGIRDSEGYANTTLGIDYTGTNNGSIWNIHYGDGAVEKANDAGNYIAFNGAEAKFVGRSYGLAGNIVDTPQYQVWDSKNWGTDWHHFSVHIKYNSGTSVATEKNDGEYRVAIDGVTYVDAVGLFNRHWSNKPIERIVFFDWAQTGDQPFTVAIDDVKITIPDAKKR